MAQSRPLPWLLLALASGVLGWFLGRWIAPTPEPADTGNVARAEITPHVGPLLQGTPGRGPGASPARGTRDLSGTGPALPGATGTPGTGTPPPGAPTEPPDATPPGAAAPEVVPTVPTLFLPRGEGWTGLGWQGAEPAPEDPALTETVRLMASAPEAAAERIESLLAGSSEDRKRAYAALANARHPLHRRLAERALADAHADDDVQGVMRALARLKGRDWSPEQMTGPPDTPIAGDLPSAWASKQAEMGEVWIELDYPESVLPESLRIHETCGPGAVTRIYALDGEDPAAPGARWVELWSGAAPSPEAPVWFEVGLEARVRTRSIRLIVDTGRVGGWNEIDAVELLGSGRRQWASGARAGSSYSD